MFLSIASPALSTYSRAGEQPSDRRSALLRVSHPGAGELVSGPFHHSTLLIYVGWLGCF